MNIYSAIIVSYNNGNELFDCLLSLLQSNVCDEIIIIDNGNNIQTREKIEKLAQNNIKIKYNINYKNLGFGAACNMGAKQAKNENLLFLNPDAILLPNALNELEINEKPQENKLIGGLIINNDGIEQRGARRGELNTLTAFASMTGLTKVFKNKIIRDFNQNNEPLPLSPIEVANISGAFFTLKAESFCKLGGFDEGFFLHLEDIDICKRFRNLGGKVYFNPNARAIHKGGASKASKIIVEWFKFKGFIRYFWKHGNFFEKILTILIILPLFILIIGRAMVQQFRNGF